jgi:hypothetical protein
MDRHLYVSFGTSRSHECWLIGIGDESIPETGAMIDLSLPDSPQGRDIAVEVRYRTWIPGSPLHIYAYAGTSLPDNQLRERLIAGGCHRIDTVSSTHILDTVLNVPSTSVGHEILMIMGSINNYEAWRIYSNSMDNVVPLFGQRLTVPLTSMDTVYWSDLLNTSPPPSNGVSWAPGIIFYSTKADSGEARVGLWIDDTAFPARISGYELLSSGWEKLSVDYFNPLAFDTWERIDLATRTTLFELETPNNKRIVDFEIAHWESIPIKSYSLLPIAMQHYCRMKLLKLEDASGEYF